MKRWNQRMLSEIERIASRCRELSLDPSELNDTIHQVRRVSKNLRSLIRLIAPKPSDNLRKVYLQLRQLSRTLSPYRDQVVFVQTLGRVKDRLQSKKPKAARVFKILAKEQVLKYNLNEKAQPVPSLVQQALKELQQAARSLESQLIGGEVELRSKTIFSSHLFAWKKFRRRAKIVNPESPIEEWHDLRKAAKSLEYQLKLLRRFSFVDLNKSYMCMEKVGNHLGWFNDLAKANEFIESGSSSLGIEITITQQDRELFLSITAQYSGNSRRQAMAAIKRLLVSGKKLRGMESGDVIF
jgi:CHAD domain-containing protein